MRALESRFLAGRRIFTWDLLMVFRLLRELFASLRCFRALGPCVLVVGQNPDGLRWTQAVAASEAMGRWLASQGFTVLTFDESGLADRLARSAERVGGRVLRCRLPERARGFGSAEQGQAFDFRYELVRRLVTVKYSYATIALGPTGEAPGTVHFLLALARFGRIPDHSLLLLHPSQWERWRGILFDSEHPSPIATRPIEGAPDLAREFEALLSA